MHMVDHGDNIRIAMNLSLRLITSCRSLRDILYTLVVIAGASALLTYHLSRNLSTRHNRSSSMTSLNGEQLTSSDDKETRIVLEGLEFDMRLRAKQTQDKSVKSQDDEEFIGLGAPTSRRNANYSHVESEYKTGSTDQHSHRVDASISGTNNPENLPLRGKPCSDDDTTLPVLCTLSTNPPLDMRPSFNGASVTDYYATVSHSVILLQVVTSACHCQSDARLSDRHGPSRVANFTLGLGLNRLFIFVVDTQSSIDNPRVFSTYILTIYRQTLSSSVKSGRNMIALRSCSLRQDCTLHYLPEKVCGLHESVYGSWNHFVDRVRRLPRCVSGSEPGEWILPCSDCSNATSCSWQDAVWQPMDCVHWRIQPQQLRQCLAGRKILFLGDSTNRGIMHYAMEQLNGSLTDWDKTHDAKVYTNINNNNTLISFAYYPQFWISPGHRPLLGDTLAQLLRMNYPVEDNYKTVLIVGGVHWLSTQHLHVISNALHRLKLSNIQVIVKTLGAGFHQPVDGLHHLTLSEQRHLVRHNEDLMVLCRLLGFDVIDTFHMTMARYKDFLQGKCACHFHRVREILPSFSKYLRSTSQQGNHKMADMPIHYHVEGDINSAYSDILLGRICGHG